MNFATNLVWLGKHLSKYAPLLIKKVWRIVLPIVEQFIRQLKNHNPVRPNTIDKQAWHISSRLVGQLILQGKRIMILVWFDIIDSGYAQLYDHFDMTLEFAIITRPGKSFDNRKIKDILWYSTQNRIRRLVAIWLVSSWQIGGKSVSFLTGRDTVLWPISRGQHFFTIRSQTDHNNRLLKMFHCSKFKICSSLTSY